jgi:hypothetical protein
MYVDTQIITHVEEICMSCETYIHTCLMSSTHKNNHEGVHGHSSVPVAACNGRKPGPAALPMASKRGDTQS